VLIAVEGTHNAGKTTFATALAAGLLDLGHRTGLVCEVVRDNIPIIEAVRAGAPFTLGSQIQLAAHHIAVEAMRQAGHDIVVTDRSAMNVLGYLGAQEMTDGSEESRQLLDAFANFLANYSRAYAVVFLCRDQFAIDYNDAMRSGTSSWQSSVLEHLEQALADMPCPTIVVPSALSTSERVAFALRTLRDRGHLAP
jgi:predicted ATPase